MYHQIYQPFILSSALIEKQSKFWHYTEEMESPSVISIKHISEKLYPQAPKEAGCQFDYDKVPLEGVTKATRNWLLYFNPNLEIRFDQP